MNPNVNKFVAGVLGTVATSLETEQVLPPGIATAICTVLVYLLGLWHPQIGAPKAAAP